MIKFYYDQIFLGPSVKIMLPEVATAGKEAQNCLEMPRNPLAGNLSEHKIICLASML
jgi:hypothetical protein